MASRQMTFSIPDEVAEQFTREIAEPEQSRFVADLLKRKLRERGWTEAELIAACQAVNADEELNQLVDDWQAVNDPIEEPWDDAAPR